MAKKVSRNGQKMYPVMARKYPVIAKKISCIGQEMYPVMAKKNYPVMANKTIT